MVNFDLTVSDQAFDEKLPKGSPKYKDITFTQRNITIEEFERLIMQGRLFSSVFKKPHISINEKTKDNLVCSSIIAIDIDDSDCPMSDYIETLTVQPTIAYETFGNMKNGNGYRFRYIYVFNTPIYGYETYKAVYNALCASNHIHDLSNDTSMRSAVQMFYGTDENAMIVVNGNTYCIDDFVDDGSVPTTVLLKQQHHPTIREKSGHLKEHYHFTDEAFKNKWHSASDIRILYDFRDAYFSSDHTIVDFEDGELWKDVIDTYYYKVHRRYKTENNRHRINRLKYGEKRCNCIFVALVKRRLIDPTLTFEHMCYAAIYELYNYIDNTNKEHLITRERLYQIAESAMNANLNDYAENLREHKVFSTNKDEANKRGITIQKAVGIANGKRWEEKRDKEFSELEKKYDQTLSDRKNAELMGVSKTKVCNLKKWIREKTDMKYPTLDEEDSTQGVSEDAGRIELFDLGNLSTHMKTTRPDTFESLENNFGYVRPLHHICKRIIKNALNQI